MGPPEKISAGSRRTFAPNSDTPSSLPRLGAGPPKAKPLKGIIPGAGVLEIAEDFDRNTYRVVYTVRFADAVYVLHAFQKKSRHGIKTPKHEIDLIRTRFAEAKAHYEGSKK